MAMNSIITNMGAMVALQSLNKTADELAQTQKRMTGFRVADAKDDGAAFAVAERVRGDINATQSANDQLGGLQGLIDVASASLENVSKTLDSLKSLTVKLADNTLTTDQRSQYQTQAKTLTNNIKAYIEDASYNNRNILNENNTTQYQSTNRLSRNSVGTTYSVNGFTAIASVFNTVSSANTYTAGSAAAALTATGSLNTAIARTLTQLNQFGSYSNYIDSQIKYNSAKADAQRGGIGYLVDADLAKESARLQSLQIRQQLGTQALGIANQAPQTLLSLFR